MKKGRKEIMGVRAISVGFSVLTLGVFKPFGLDAWQWQAYAHLLIIWVLGIAVCLASEGILKYIIRIPHSHDNGISYILRRNLWFQIINTPLEALMICLYRHFVLSNRAPGNMLSWSNYFETLVIIAFCSFALGLYWRFKYRNKYLAAELEETRQLNEQLMKSQTASEQSQSTITLTGSTSEAITIRVNNLLYIETVANYTNVCYLSNGEVRTDILRATSKQLQDELEAYHKIVRCHRAFLVNLDQVERIESHSGSMRLIIKHCHQAVPVSRSNTTAVKQAIKQP